MLIDESMIILYKDWCDLVLIKKDIPRFNLSFYEYCMLRTNINLQDNLRRLEK